MVRHLVPGTELPTGTTISDVLTDIMPLLWLDSETVRLERQSSRFEKKAGMKEANDSSSKDEDADQRGQASSEPDASKEAAVDVTQGPKRGPKVVTTVRDMPAGTIALTMLEELELTLRVPRLGSRRNPGHSAPGSLPGQQGL